MNEYQLRQQLADRLEKGGYLRSAEWRTAIEAVPRHLFIPEFFRPVDSSQGAMWEPVTPGIVDIQEWMELAYENKTWVIQIDGHIHPNDTKTPIPAGNPTSSSTLPGLVVAMLEDLEVSEGNTVLEIGTGTGYSTALLCKRLGAEHVVSVETDPGLASRAARAIHQVGHKPTLITGNGLDGFAQCAPYDRIIATCSVRHIPSAWITQSRPEAIILTTLSGWLYGSGYAKLIVGSNGTAYGRLLPETYSFMLARPHLPPPVDISDTQEIDISEPRLAAVSPNILNDWTALFIAQLAVPGAQCIGKSVDDGPMVDYYYDAETGSIASLAPHSDGTHLVREAGPVRLWSRIEDSVTKWRQYGSPGIEQFLIKITPDSQTVFMPGNNALTWQLPL